MGDVNNPSSSTSMSDPVSRPDEIPFPAAGDIAPNLMSSGSRREADHPGVHTSRCLDHDRRDSSLRSSSTSTVAETSTTLAAGEEALTVTPVHGGATAENGLAFPPTHRTTTTTSGKPYSSFSPHMKWMIVILAGIAAVFSPIRFVLLAKDVPNMPNRQLQYIRPGNPDLGSRVQPRRRTNLTRNNRLPRISSRHPLFLWRPKRHIRSPASLPPHPHSLPRRKCRTGLVSHLRILAAPRTEGSTSHWGICGDFNWIWHDFRYCRTEGEGQVYGFVSGEFDGWACVWTVVRWSVCRDFGMEVDFLVLDHCDRGHIGASYLVSRNDL
jgi:hypothetical protein